MAKDARSDKFENNSTDKDRKPESGHVELLKQHISEHDGHKISAVELSNTGAGTYKVGHQFENGSKIEKIEVKKTRLDGKPLPLDGEYLLVPDSTDIHLNNGACLNIVDDHLRSVTYPSRDVTYFDFDEKDNLAFITFQTKNLHDETWKREANNLWVKDPEHHEGILGPIADQLSDLAAEKWYGSFVLSNSGDLLKVDKNGVVDTIYCTDGIIMSNKHGK